MNQIEIKNFVLSFFRNRNAEEAAISAGIDPVDAKLGGLKLLQERRVKRQLSALQKKMSEEQCEIRAGLERLAYGRVNDAVALVFAEEITPAMLSQADLYNISEIKKIKGGGVEIKFFDRQKALERLDEFNVQLKNDQKAKNLVEAIYGSDSARDTVIESDNPQEGEGD